MTAPQVQAKTRRLTQRVAPAGDHQVVLFPGVARPHDVVAAKEVSPIAAEQKRMWQMALDSYKGELILENIKRTFAVLDAAIRNPANEAIDTSVENGSSVKTAATLAHANAFHNLSYMAQDLKNRGKVEEGEALFAVLKTAKANREAPEYVTIIQQQRPDPDRAVKDLQAGLQQRQL